MINKYKIGGIELIKELLVCRFFHQCYGTAAVPFLTVPKSLLKIYIAFRVIGILNAKVMDNKNGSSKNELSLSVDHPDKILELGDSVDVSRCQAKKPDGSGCTNLVNYPSNFF